MMKRFVLILALSFAAGAYCSYAQQADVIESLASHPEYLDGTDMLCPVEAVKLTPAPRGYKPVYISHYGRHGARFGWQSDLYERLNDVFSAAEKEDNLTPLGIDYKRRFDSLYPELRYRVGDLSPKGWWHQQQLASRMYDNFPSVFNGDAHVRAWTSTSTRCVMTMSSFCLGLKERNPKLYIFENFGKYFLPAILPQDSSNPFRVKAEKVPVAFDETWHEYIARTIEVKPILARLFKDVDKALPSDKQWDFLSYLYFYAAGMNSLDTDLRFYDIFTPEDRVALWKIDNFQFYTEIWPTHAGYKPIVDDIIAKADERLAAGDKGADLRFGHDYTFLPLLMLLGVNGYGHAVDNPDDIPTWSRLQDVPMGANLHFVFFRSKRSDKVLFKVLLNGTEARLPLDTDTWPYYDWEVFKAYHNK